MAIKKIKIPASLDPTKKIFTSLREAETIGAQQITSRVKVNIMRSQIDSKYDFFPDESVKSAYLGTPVFSQLIIKKEIDSIVGSQQTSDNYAKFDAIIATVNQTRHIVTTPIQGRNGTVKEYISDGDYEINIKGIITSAYPERMPKEEMENIATLLKLQNEIVMISDYLSLFKIQYAVVMSYVFTQIEGSVNQVQMDLRLLSDEPVEIKLGIDSNA